MNRVATSTQQHACVYQKHIHVNRCISARNGRLQRVTTGAQRTRELAVQHAPVAFRRVKSPLHEAIEAPSPGGSMQMEQKQWLPPSFLVSTWLPGQYLVM